MDFRGVAPTEWETPTIVPGRKGLNWFDAKDQIDPEEALYRANLIQNFRGELALRPGQTQQVTGLGSVTAIQRMDLPATSSFMRFWAGGNNWWRGNAGPSILEGGFSGNPITMLAYRPALSGDPWMIAADSSKMRQASATGPSIPIGLPAPATAAVAAVTSILTTGISSFDSGDGTAAANWSYTAGVDRAGNPTTVPTGVDTPGLQGNCVAFTTNPGGAAADTGYSSILGRAKAMDLTKLQGGTVDAFAEDLVHLWLKVDRPDYLEEVRIYFVCSTFDPTVIPGTSGTVNTDGFVKAIRANDITPFIENILGSVETGDLTRSTDLVQQYLNDQELGITPDTVTPLGGGGRVSPSQTSGVDSLPTQSSMQLVAGRDVWSEFGNIDRPLRRGEFLRFGNQPTVGWNTITGIIIVIQTSTNQAVTLSCDDWFLTGGYELDTTEATATAYDWRYTNYHLDTGDESNPSPEMADNSHLEMLRQSANVTPVPYGSARVRQKFYRRGGSLPTDWYYSGMNSADGALYVDRVGDTEAAASPTLELDNYQPVPTVNSAGTTVLAQPLPSVFGPLGGKLLGVGDPYRPGHLYSSKTERGGSWPPANALEVCPPSEELLWGTLIGGVAFVLSRKKGYIATVNMVNGEVAVQDTQCLVGGVNRWAWAVGPKGIYFVSADSDAPGVYRTGGQEATLVSQKIDPLFKGKAVEYTPGVSVLPLDWAQANSVRLSIFQNNLWLSYKDTGGATRTIIQDLLTEEWHLYNFANPPQMTYAEEGLGSSPQMWLGCSDGSAHTHVGTSDNGTAITGRVVTGYNDGGRPREDKLLGDVIFDADIPTGVTLSMTTRLNNGVLVNPAMPFTGLSGRRRYQGDPFGTVTQRARNLQLDFSWASTTASALYFAGVAIAPQPDQVLKRATTWESFETEQYFWGLTLVADTQGQPITCVVEYTQGNSINTAATIVLQATGRRLLQFSWPAVKADQIRVRSVTEDCGFWMLFKVEWIKTKEPPRIAGWDSGFENLGDSYYTGLDLEVDTLGKEKQVEVMVDGTAVTNPATGGTIFSMTANGRRTIHLTFGPARGHIYRFHALDANPGLLYTHKWHIEEEPSEQTNWNQNFTLAGTLTDKYVKGVLLECDTFGLDKTVRIEGDNGLLATITVNTNGRLVQHFAFPQALARVVRILPTDNNPGRLYSAQWIFDEEPLQLQRWETQLVDHGIQGEHSLFSAQVSIKSAGDVVLNVQAYNNSGVLVSSTNYTIPSTGGAKQKLYVEFQAYKGVLWKYTFTPALGTTGFWLYREESSVLVLPWGATVPITRAPFGSDDLDKVRQMGNASGRAETPNNGPVQNKDVTLGLMTGGEGLT